MNSGPVSKTVVALLFVTGMVFAQDSPIVSPPLTAKPGTILTVRINEPLSSDHNNVGDVFSATLTQPVIVLGIVVARYGQIAAGRIGEVKKAGKVSGVSHLGITLTSLTLVDGQTVPIQSQLLLRNGPTSVGRDVAGIAGTTGIGAAIGAVANGGRGAAIGAAAGAAAGTIGVLLTKGDPTVVGPETLLTFEATARLPSRRTTRHRRSASWSPQIIRLHKRSPSRWRLFRLRFLSLIRIPIITCPIRLPSTLTITRTGDILISTFPRLVSSLVMLATTTIAATLGFMDMCTRPGQFHTVAA